MSNNIPNSDRYNEILDRIDALADEHGRGSNTYETKVRKLLRNELSHESFTIQTFNHDELVIESELFIGHHSGKLGRHELFYDEFGIYTLRGTDDSTEFVGSHDLVKEAQQKQREQEQEQHASLTAAERNPGLAKRRRI